jgi:hypothetical protein
MCHAVVTRGPINMFLKAASAKIITLPKGRRSWGINIVQSHATELIKTFEN